MGKPLSSRKVLRAQRGVRDAAGDLREAVQSRMRLDSATAWLSPQDATVTAARMWEVGRCP